MNQISVQFSSARWLVVVVLTVISGSLHFTDAAESPPANTNAPSIALDALVADVLEHNPELNFYRAEIAAAKGEHRTAATWANPEISTTVGQKQVRSGGRSDEGVAWSVSVQQTFEWPGRIPLRKTIANHQMQLAELGFAQFKSALAARARTLAYNVFAAQEKAAVAKDVADLHGVALTLQPRKDLAGVLVHA
jgi:cobalt-zinc-cadmium efflux system outer membrane protein